METDEKTSTGKWCPICDTFNVHRDMCVVAATAENAGVTPEDVIGLYIFNPWSHFHIPCALQQMSRYASLAAIMKTPCIRGRAYDEKLCAVCSGILREPPVKLQIADDKAPKYFGNFDEVECTVHGAKQCIVPVVEAGKRGHHYPMIQATVDCGYKCGCWMGPARSGGPDGVDPFGVCPAEPPE